ncbi:hypothetical protein BsWGS_16560 [Bradybaena similaris]
MASSQKARSVIVGIQQLTSTWRSRSLLHGSLRFTSSMAANIDNQFDTRILQVLVCPLTKKPLRYDEKRRELVCDELGVAYPIVEGIPNMNPQDARMIGSTDKGGCEPSQPPRT